MSAFDYRQWPVAIIFGGRESAEPAHQIGQTLRTRYTADQLPILAILHLPGVPRLVQGMVKKQLEKDYQRAVVDETAILRAAGQPVPVDPSEFVIMLTDWEGKTAASFDQRAGGRRDD